MGEVSKQVRVDNWGIYFLSRLQVFFNKTDYCDLTLQFEGNVQLKVHRLVMNACTEYFQVLEQTCETIDDILLMPPDLQADVILPIVNFIYTGMLEYEISLYDKLYKTAELMNITVLLKLLDAQKQPSQPNVKSVVSKVPPVYNLQGKKITPKSQEKSLPPTLPGRKLPVWKRKNIPNQTVVAKPTSSFITEIKRPSTIDSLNNFDNAPKPTRFEWPEEDFQNFNLLDTSFDSISYNSKPLLTQEDEIKASTSFSQSKEEYSAVNLDELKNYVKEQKIRNDIEYEEYVDNDLDLCDPDYIPETTVKRKKDTGIAMQPANKKVRFNINEKENKETKINITPSGKGEVDHSKIISEVLKKYPHLVKKNKNIRLKILPKGKTPETLVKPAHSKLKMQVKTSKPAATTMSVSNKPTDQKEDGPWVCTKCSVEGSEQVEFVLYYLYRKHMTDVHHEKFDSKMCKYCGHQFTKNNLLIYHQLMRHSVKPPVGYTFPKCEQCPYIALSNAHLEKHKAMHSNFEFQCKVCKVCFNSDGSLKQHTQITGHTGTTGRNNYDCQYCTKHFQTGAHLFMHIRGAHRDEAERDGMVSLDDDEDYAEEESTADECLSTQKTVKVLDNIKVKAREAATAEDHQQSFLKNSGITTNLGLVDIVVLDDNSQYILHPNSQQLVTQQSLSNNPEYILPDLQETYVQDQNINQVITTSQHNVITQSMLNNTDIASTDELVMVLTDHDYNDGNNEILSNDNSNIVVLYSHPVEGQNNQFITSQSNIMLNSETGMLEISSLPNTAEAIESQNTVESIEMIQREIESHNNQEQLKAIENKPMELEIQVPTPMDVEESTDQQHEIIELKDVEEQKQQNEATPKDNANEKRNEEKPIFMEKNEREECKSHAITDDDDSSKQIVELVEEIVEIDNCKDKEVNVATDNMKIEDIESKNPEIEAIEVDAKHSEVVVTEGIITSEKEQKSEVPSVEPELKEDESSLVETINTNGGNTVDAEEINSTSEASIAIELNENEVLSQNEDLQKMSEEKPAILDNQSQAAKMSILDDWEDTDSQQSEHGKSQSTVNKLINDWDD